jgi:hypothetical protein
MHEYIYFRYEKYLTKARKCELKCYVLLCQIRLYLFTCATSSSDGTASNISPINEVEKDGDESGRGVVRNNITGFFFRDCGKL